MKTTIAFCLAFLAINCSSAQPPSKMMFDDFTYASVDDLAKNGWIIRSEAGWPGVPGAKGGKERFSVHDGVLRLTSSTDGSPANTPQSQLCHARKYFEGTYAARVRFTDAPVSGPNGDQIVQTLYLISPQKAPMDLDYSELDFEYLPNGGWGKTGPTMFATTWETFQLEPWIAVNQSDSVGKSYEGWRTLVLQVSAGKARYYVDGALLAEHGDKYYPEVPMSINFNLWFVRDGVLQSTEMRRWVEDIDWVFHEVDKVLTPADVEKRVAALRKKSVKFTDTVPPKVPALASPCNF